MIHSDTALKSLLENESQEAARSALLQKLAPLHDFGGVRVTVVYDGIGDDISIVRRDKILTLSEVFTPSDMTADELIEQLCSTSKNPGHLLVVSRDNLLRLTASSFGAMSITPEKALEWGGQSAKSISSAAASNNRKSAVEWRRQSPFSALDALAADLKSAMSPALIIRLIYCAVCALVFAGRRKISVSGLRGILWWRAFRRAEFF